MAWLLDTNILSEIRKPRPEPKVVIFVSGTPLDELYVSAVTLAELRFGIDLLSQGSTQRANLSQWLTNTIRPMFNDRVLPVTEDIMFRWRVLMEDGRKSGHTFSQPDLIIAATALQHGLTVVTRDRSDFDKARVPVVNPWDAS
jgi:predicted nucleic acid-binding protein